ncbi:hypothetical protein BU17DRAFT_63242 [Hysterangium stoloniferum]|nr:hypothetical protein BU17DRAFT_63242 [Hysterangium stoloniferum]
MARAYAISNKNILLIVILLLLVFASTGLVVLLLQKSPLALDTIQATIVVGYDTIIFLITIWYMLSTVRRQRSLPDQFEKKSILFLIVYRGALRYGFVLTVTVTAAVTFKTLRVSLQGVIAPVQNLRDDCTVGHTLDQVTLGTFKAATGRVHEAVVDEFGDTDLIDSLQVR